MNILSNLQRISIILIVSLNIAVGNSKNETSSKSEGTTSDDIHVEAFVRDTNLLRLNVTILAQSESNFDVSITSTEENPNDTHCKPVNHCKRYDCPGNKTSTIFPKNHRYTVQSDAHCMFQNDCSYNITAKNVKTGKIISTVYHIKDCVNGHCSCRYAHNLPKPLVFPKLVTSTQLFFTWEVPDSSNITHDAALQDLAIEIHEMRDCNLSWSDTRSIASFHAKLNNYGIPIRKSDFTKELSNSSDAKCLRIRLHVIDTQNCAGPFVNVTVPLTMKHNSERNQFTFELLLMCVAGGIITTIAIIMIMYAVLWRTRKKSIVNYWRNFYNNTQHGGGQMIPMTENLLYFEKESDADWFEIPLSSIKEIGQEIGKGAFGRVFIARISDIPGKLNSQIVAIKKLKKSPTTDQLDEFLGEISTMKKVGQHPNIVRLLGFCTQSQPLMMIMEFVPCGDLLKYLRAVRAKHESTLSRANKNVSSNNFNNHSTMKNSSSHQSQGPGLLGKYLDILHSHSTSSASETSSYITQPDSLPSTQQNHLNRPSSSFAETMYTNLTVPSNPELNKTTAAVLEYVVDHIELHNFALQIARGMKHLHDLQITHRDLAARNILIDENKTLKISDFGLSRTGIYVNTRNKKVPLRWLSIEAVKDNLYSSKSDVWAFAIVLWEIGTLGGFPYPTVSNHELLNFLKSGQRLEKPDNCSDTLYELMLECWAMDPDDRPDFEDIITKLDPNKNKIYIDFSELDPNYVFPPTADDFKVLSVNEKLSKV